jgi:hypothetical protein
VFRGSIPILGGDKNFSTNMKIFLGDNLVVERNLGHGQFDIEIPVETSEISKNYGHVRITFSHDQYLPKPDGRPAVAYVSFLGFN